MSNNKSNEIRIPCTTVQLVLILGKILRKHLRIKMIGTECWTFIPSASMGVYGHCPAYSTEEDVSLDVIRKKTQKHFIVWYYGFGYCYEGTEASTSDKLELRVTCDHHKSIDSFDFWYFQLWLRRHDGSIERHYFQCDLGHGNKMDVARATLSGFPNLQEHLPKIIAFSDK